MYFPTDMNLLWNSEQKCINPCEWLTDNEYKMDYGIINDFPKETNYDPETVWSAGVEYMLSRDFLYC